MTIEFKPLAELHFSLLLKWLETPHVKEWWDKDVKWTIDLIREKYGTYVKLYKLLKLQGKLIEKAIYPFIVTFDETPIGYIQYYDKHDFPPEQNYETIELPKSCAGLDLYIGVSEFINKNIGTETLEFFVELHVSSKFDYVLVDPNTDNLGAIRAYEKAGFKEIKKVNCNQITLMMEKCQKIR